MIERQPWMELEPTWGHYIALAVVVVLTLGPVVWVLVAWLVGS